MRSRLCLACYSDVSSKRFARQSLAAVDSQARPGNQCSSDEDYCMPSFVAGSFALAGLIAAAAPLVIHLLNRRRYRVVDWAAMDLLREALSRNKRLLHLRDLVLLALRTLCVLLFALA